ncbi:MAG: hypothetical protein C4337_04015 [Armatimonadota bacterium]
MRDLFALLSVGLGLVLSAWAQSVEPARFPANRMEQPPIIDGVVNPDEWCSAYRIDRFWSPLRQQWGAFPTRAYIGYDSQYLYVAFECEDPDPQQIQARETKRGGNLEADDTVAVLVDPQARGLKPYAFTVNARGTQSEEIPIGTAENIRWRGDWDAAVQRTEWGWSAEVRIPLRILRYPPKQNRFGIILERHVARLRELYTFPNMGAYYSDRSQALWEGLQLPPPRYPILLLPYYTGDRATEREQSRGGIDIRYVQGDALTALLTYKPDFENIAGDVAKVDFSYTERVLEEQRPFFQEGSDFMPPRAVFYSLRVPDVTVGGKAFGTLGNWRYGALVGEYASNGAVHQFGVGRLHYQFGPRAFAGLVATRLQGDVEEENLGTILEIQRITPSGEWRFVGTLYRLTGAREGLFQQHTFYTQSPPRAPSYYIQYTDIEPTYRPRLAYVPETGFRGVRMKVAWFDQPESQRPFLWSVNLGLSSRQRYSNQLLDEGASVEIEWWLTANTYLETEMSYLRRPPNIDRTLALAYTWNALNRYRKGMVEVRLGDLNGGRSRYSYLEQAFELAPRLRLRASYEDLHIGYASLPDDRARQFILTLNYEIDSERAIGGRFISSRTEFEGTVETLRNFYLTYFQRVRSGFDIYFIYGLPNATRPQNRFAIKIVTPIEL